MTEQIEFYTVEQLLDLVTASRLGEIEQIAAEVCTSMTYNDAVYFHDWQPLHDTARAYQQCFRLAVENNTFPSQVEDEWIVAVQLGEGRVQTIKHQVPQVVIIIASILNAQSRRMNDETHC